MPGKHSPAKLAERRARAIRLGYALPRSDGKKYVEVPQGVARNVQVMAQSLELHRQHQEIAGRPFHYARLATAAAATAIGPVAARAAQDAHKQANQMKHRVNWADALLEDTVSAACPPVVLPTPTCGASSLPPSPPPSRSVNAETQTEIVVLDNVRGASCFSVEVACQTSADECALRPDAPVFYPPSAPMDDFAFSYWNQLFAAQNNTIAVLTARLDECMPSQKRMRQVERTLQTTESKLEQLRKSMTDAIDQKVRASLVDSLYVRKAEVGSLVAAGLESVRSYVDERMEIKSKTAVPDCSAGYAPSGAPSVGDHSVEACPSPAVRRPEEPACAGDAVTYVPSVGDTVRLSGLTSIAYNDKIAKVLSAAGSDSRVALRVLPRGPEIRVLRDRLCYPARCRLCGDRIHSETCENCCTPSDFHMNEIASPPSSGDALPPWSGSKVSRDPSPSPMMKLSNAEMDRRVAAAQWSD